MQVAEKQESFETVVTTLPVLRPLAGKGCIDIVTLSPFAYCPPGKLLMFAVRACVPVAISVLNAHRLFMLVNMAEVVPMKYSTFAKAVGTYRCVNWKSH